MSPTKVLPVVTLALLAGLTLAACGSSSPSRPVTGTAGTGAAGTTAGGAGTTAEGTAGATGTAGTNASGGAGTGSAGTVVTGTAGTGAAGTLTTGTAGTGTDAGAAGTTADGGSAGSGGTAYHRFVCPPGPYPAQKRGTPVSACVGFAFNYDYVEGPTWIATQNAFFFSNFVHGNPTGTDGGDIIKVDMNGQCSVWAHDVGTNGLAVGATGNIVAACHKTRSITEFDINTKAPKILADMYMGQKFDSPNDLIVHSNGTVYFSNPDYELGARPKGFGGPNVHSAFRIDPSGVVSLIAMTGTQPNGVGLSPDEKKLYIVGLGVWNLDDKGVPTTKTGEGAPNADGFAVDCAGNITTDPTNSAYGGLDGKTLIVVSQSKTIKLIPVTVPGLP